MRKPSYLT